MTYKQIIIDGIDVSGCQYYKIPQNEMYPMSNFCDLPCIGFCKNDPKCSYKQWKRKEQECEELAYENYELNELFDRLKAENEKLDTENKRLVAELVNPVFDSFEELDKLKQTLTEIKEIAEFYNNSNMDDICYQDGIYEILQKISEVENEN